ncbi:MAG: aldo/keto reductase [Clostridia bacterium]|nr:aldo/keto reductase [Clostridia bacterium]
MKYVQTKGLNLSSFALGTVQLGLTYGLGENSEKPTEQAAFEILDRAVNLGVNTLDTANNYGDSEAVIGKWLTKRRKDGKDIPFIVTKTGPHKHGSYDILRDDILYQLEGCMKRLCVDKLDMLMLHDYEDYATDRDNMRKIFADLKAQGLYDYSAISAYSRHDYGVIADSGFDATQIPLNVFDWGQIENGGLQRLADSGMMIFTRSVFLQGLVFHTPEDLDPRMDFCFPYLNKFIELCKEFNLSPATLALSFVLSLPGVTQAVMGCDTAEQVEANCKLFDETVKLTPEQMNKLRDAFFDIDPRVINPGMWFNRMK